RVARERMPSSFGFRHALTRDAVLSQLLPAERARYAARLLALVEADLEEERSELAAELAHIAGDGEKAARLLLRSGQTLLAKGALATAETALLRAQALLPVNAHADLQGEIEHVLLRVLSQSGKYERVLEVGEALLSALRRTSAPALQYAEAHLTMATAAVAASDLPRATQHLKAARELDNGRALEARLDALSAHVAIDERRTDDAERLAQA